MFSREAILNIKNKSKIKGAVKDIYQAKKALKLLLNNEDVHPVCSKEKERIRDYANSVLGAGYHRYWLEFYTAYQGCFYPGWVTPSFYEKNILSPRVMQYKSVGAVKTMAKRLLRSENISDLGYYINGCWYNLGFEPVSKDEFSKKIFEGQEKVVIKPDMSNKGRGVVVLDKSNFHDFYPNCDFVVQSFIEPDGCFFEISNKGVCVLRVTTYLKDDKVRFLASHFRSSLGDADVIRAEEKLLFSVSRDGYISDFGSDYRWRRFWTHPDTGREFSGFRIPRFSEAIEVCVSHHAFVPWFNVIGWDVLIPEEGPVSILEWNTSNPDIKFHEASIGPCFSG